ncbi:efflux RND transporter periplasmic adaptor subunit [Chitinophagaceae bacterium MMS25-I14]
MKKSIIIIAAVAFASCSAEKKKEQPKGQAAHYTLATVAKGGVPVNVRLPAQLAAYEEVSIFPKVNGYVKEVPVDIGSHVTKGQLLMVLDAPELTQEVMEQKEKYTKAQSDYIIAKENYERLVEASRTQGAVSPMDLSSAKAHVASVQALSNAAKANLDMQQTQLAYLRITAPFAGIITERNVHPGALVSATVKDKPMLELKQMQHLRLQVDVPESISAGLKEKDSLSFVVNGQNSKKMTAFISRRSGNISAQYRSERMEADVPNDGTLSAGMYADVLFHSAGDATAFHVPKSAVVVSTQGKYVLAVRNGKAVKLSVSTGNESPEQEEITGDLHEGDQVISNANEEIKEGTAVK